MNIEECKTIEELKEKEVIGAPQLYDTDNLQMRTCQLIDTAAEITKRQIKEERSCINCTAFVPYEGYNDVGCCKLMNIQLSKGAYCFAFTPILSVPAQDRGLKATGIIFDDLQPAQKKEEK